MTELTDEQRQREVDAYQRGFSDGARAKEASYVGYKSPEEVEEIVREERERIAEIYIRYHDTIAPKDIRQFILNGIEPAGWEAKSKYLGEK